MRLLLAILAIVLLILAAVIGFDWFTMNGKDAQHAFQGLLAFGVAAGFASLHVP
jgi:hypothetical protein